MIPHETVRGRTPPPWFRALSGLERMRAFSRGLLPWPPLSRLLGMRATHVVPGGVTITMPAGEMSLAPNGQLEIVPVMVSALEGACITGVPAGVDIVPLKFDINPFRPAWVRQGNLLARARILNSSNLFVFCEVQLEDPEGRHIAHGSLQAAIVRVEPPPPPAPEVIKPAQEPTYETPDPFLRNFAVNLPLAQLKDQDGLTIIRALGEDSFRAPIMDTYDLHLGAVEEGRSEVSIPASEWFCSLGGNVSPAVIAAFGDMAGWTTGMSIHRPGKSVIGLDGSVRFLRPVAPDGRRLRADTTVKEPRKDLFFAETSIRDADGTLVALHSGAVARVDEEQRVRRSRREARRVLATLLFTDIVDSTKHAERLGDARWRTLLEDHRHVIRGEVSRYNGTEVDTAGDGFFARFESPAQAIQAARAMRGASAALGIEVRTGIHTGECELEGTSLAGMAVHIAARIQAAAKANEILVSSTVKDLAVGSHVSFEDRGEHRLKGVPDPWRLHAVRD
jgi:uncharacterized protein (TIGR00369 family)